MRTHAASTAGLARFPGADPECDAGWLGELAARVAERPLADRRVQLAAAVLASVRGCGASGREQISTTQPCVSRSRSAQTAGAKERAASHHFPPPAAGGDRVPLFRLRRATRPTSRRAASGLRRESHDEPKVQRTRSMTGNVAIHTKLTAEGYGGQSGSAYRRSGRFGTPANRPVRRVQRKRRLAFTAKETSAQRRLSRYERCPQNRFRRGAPSGVV